LNYMKAKRNTIADAGSRMTTDQLLPRPLSARSLIASLLLGMRHPARPANELVRWCGLFDVPAGTARVALSRMVERGELRHRDDRYELVGRLRDRAPEQLAAIRPRYVGWDGTWCLAVVTLDRRDAETRSQLRTEMRRHHFCEQREGVWTRPNNLDLHNLENMAAQCRIWNAEPQDDAQQFANDLFGITEWQERATTLLSLHRESNRVSTTATPQELRDSFLLSAATLSHLRADPLLPASLLPSNWRGEQLRDVYQRRAGEFSTAVGQWFRATA
jgi:phenylacetic acid degradation operon negative regulatory protein